MLPTKRRQLSATWGPHSIIAAGAEWVRYCQTGGFGLFVMVGHCGPPGPNSRWPRRGRSDCQKQSTWPCAHSIYIYYYYCFISRTKISCKRSLSKQSRSKSDLRENIGAKRRLAQFFLMVGRGGELFDSGRIEEAIGFTMTSCVFFCSLWPYTRLVHVKALWLSRLPYVEYKQIILQVRAEVQY